MEGNEGNKHKNGYTTGNENIESINDDTTKARHEIWRSETAAANRAINDAEDLSLEMYNEETETEVDGGKRRSKKRFEIFSNYKNSAEGLMDIALLSANANQLRFLLTYNHEASTYYISLGLVALSLTLQVVVGIALIFKRRLQHFTRSNEFIIGGVFMVTVVNVLLAAFTTTNEN